MKNVPFIAFYSAALLSAILIPTSVHAEIILDGPGDDVVLEIVPAGLRGFLKQDRETRNRLYREKPREWVKERQPILHDFSWHCTAGETGPFTVTVTKEGETKPASVLILHPDDKNPGTQVQITNFELGTRYVWKVEGTSEGKSVRSASARFRTSEQPPRLILIPGMDNVRDLGGWTGLDGRKIRQGLLYRSSGLNENSPDRLDDAMIKRPRQEYRLGENRATPEGLRYIVEQLGWKVDLDLRSDREIGPMTSSPAGDKVRWINSPSSSYGTFAKSDQPLKGVSVMAKNFGILSDPDNLPADFHCILGADRTGALSMAILGALGVSIDDIIRDWEISQHASPKYRDKFDQMIADFESYGLPSDSTDKKAETILQEQGVSMKEIQRLREIMLEKK